ncbi:hypothetical protein ACSBR1_016271 [Camellia fascicularis]
MSAPVSRRLHGFFTAKSTASLTKPSTTFNPSPPSSVSDLLPKPPKPTTTSPSSSDSSEDKKLKTLVKKFKKASESAQFRRRNRDYEITVLRLAAARKFSYIEDIIEHQKKYDIITKEGFTVRLIALYGRAGMFDHAHKLFDEMPQLKCERTVLSFNALLSACVNSKKFDKIGELLKDLPAKLSISPDVVSHNTVIKAFCEMGSFDSAFAVIDEMEKNGLKPDLVTFNTLLNAFYKNDRFTDAEEVWALMEDKNVVPNVRSYNPKLRALVADNRISEAIELFEEMGSKEVKPDLFSFNALIKGFCDDGNMEEAKKWYKEMSKNDCNPNRVTFTMLVQLACEKGDFDFALELCKEAISQRCLVDREVKQLVLDGLVKESKMEEAKELVELGKSNSYFDYKLELPSDK